VTIRVYDVAGRLVRTLVDGPEEPGRRSVVWDGRSSGGRTVATGVNICRMTSPGFEQTLKMVMLK
jgi:flagellar hook assembly protein FlgD